MARRSVHSYIFAVFWGLCLTGGVYGRATGSSAGSSVAAFNYRAKRYGNYYATKYFSYSGGVGYARYSRVYNSKKNKYPDYYAKIFDWFTTEEFAIYKNSPSEYISVCRNYESDINGTYLGIFTCPLPIYPDSHSYCCGAKNAEYCCRFWDIPLNVGASIVIGLMGAVILTTLTYIVVMLKKAEHIQNVTAKRKKSFFRKKQLKEFQEEIHKQFKRFTNGDIFTSTPGTTGNRNGDIRLSQNGH